MKKLYLLAVFFLLSFPATAFGCAFCLTRGPAYAFNDAKVVFIGRMVGGTQTISVKDETGKPSFIEAGKVRFVVEEMFKGGELQEITLDIDSNQGAGCGPYGLRRERYIVYAYVDEKNEKILCTYSCSRTRLAEGPYAKEDLDFLRNLPPPGTGGELNGQVWANVGTGGEPPLTDVRLQISGPDAQVITMFTDKNGRFKVNQLKPGKYKVEPELPPHYSCEKTFEEANVDDRGMASVYFEAYIDGSVTGRVLDNEGNSFNGISLELAGQGRTVSGDSTGEDGAFEVKGTPPGEYVLYLDLQAAERDKTKRYYYPGTFEQQKAAVIRVGLGERVEGIEFRLPDGFNVRTIEGEVVWKDGTPAAKVEVHLLCPQSTTPNGFHVESAPIATETDDQGRFRIEGFTGETYWLEARGSKEGAKPDEKVEFHSTGRKLSLTDNLKSLKLTLSQPGRYGRGCKTLAQKL